MDDHDGLCPECNGQGFTFFVHIFSPPDSDQWQEMFCQSCDGTGKIAAIPTEEEAAQPDPWEADEYERWLDSL